MITKFTTTILQTKPKEEISLPFPAGEEITCAEHCFDNYYKINTFAVLSNKGGNWILRTYDFEGATPDVLLPEKSSTTEPVPLKILYTDMQTPQ
ncbi:hypothetical protein MASR2M69_06630 [Bacteroidota bacterium]